MKTISNQNRNALGCYILIIIPLMWDTSVFLTGEIKCPFFLRLLDSKNTQVIHLNSNNFLKVLCVSKHYSLYTWNSTDQ